MYSHPIDPFSRSYNYDNDLTIHSLYYFELYGHERLPWSRWLTDAAPDRLILEGRLDQDFGTRTDGLMAIEFLNRPDSYLITATAEFALDHPLHERPVHVVPPGGHIFRMSHFAQAAGYMIYSGFPNLLTKIEHHLSAYVVLPGKYPFRRRKSSKASPYLPRCYRPIGPWHRIPPDVELDPTCEAALVLWKRNLVDVPFPALFNELLTSPALVGHRRVVRAPWPDEGRTTKDK